MSSRFVTLVIVKTFKKAFKFFQFQNKLVFVLFFMIQFFFLSNLFKNRLFLFKNNKWAKKAVLENPKNFKKEEEEEVKERENGIMCEIES